MGEKSGRSLQRSPISSDIDIFNLIDNMMGCCSSLSTVTDHDVKMTTPQNKKSDTNPETAKSTPSTTASPFDEAKSDHSRLLFALQSDVPSPKRHDFGEDHPEAPTLLVVPPDADADAAAIVIQSRIRTYLSRKRFQETRKAIVILQRSFILSRQRQRKQNAIVVTNEMDCFNNNNDDDDNAVFVTAAAASKLQALVRGVLLRARRTTIPRRQTCERSNDGTLTTTTTVLLLSEYNNTMMAVPVMTTGAPENDTVATVVEDIPGENEAFDTPLEVVEETANANSPDEGRDQNVKAVRCENYPHEEGQVSVDEMKPTKPHNQENDSQGDDSSLENIWTIVASTPTRDPQVDPCAVAHTSTHATSTKPQSTMTAMAIGFFKQDEQAVDISGHKTIDAVTSGSRVVVSSNHPPCLGNNATDGVVVKDETSDANQSKPIPGRLDETSDLSLPLLEQQVNDGPPAETGVDKGRPATTTQPPTDKDGPGVGTPEHSEFPHKATDMPIRKGSDLPLETLDKVDQGVCSFPADVSVIPIKGTESSAEMTVDPAVALSVTTGENASVDLPNNELDNVAVASLNQNSSLAPLGISGVCKLTDSAAEIAADAVATLPATANENVSADLPSSELGHVPLALLDQDVNRAPSGIPFVLTLPESTAEVAADPVVPIPMTASENVSVEVANREIGNVPLASLNHDASLALSDVSDVLNGAESTKEIAVDPVVPLPVTAGENASADSPRSELNHAPLASLDPGAISSPSDISSAVNGTESTAEIAADPMVRLPVTASANVSTHSLNSELGDAPLSLLDKNASHSASDVAGVHNLPDLSAEIAAEQVVTLPVTASENVTANSPKSELSDVGVASLDQDVISTPTNISGVLIGADSSSEIAADSPPATASTNVSTDSPNIELGDVSLASLDQHVSSSPSAVSGVLNLPQSSAEVASGEVVPITLTASDENHPSVSAHEENQSPGDETNVVETCKGEEEPATNHNASRSVQFSPDTPTTTKGTMSSTIASGRKSPKSPLQSLISRFDAGGSAFKTDLIYMPSSTSSGVLSNQGPGVESRPREGNMESSLQDKNAMLPAEAEIAKLRHLLLEQQQGEQQKLEEQKLEREKVEKRNRELEELVASLNAALETSRAESASPDLEPDGPMNEVADDTVESFLEGPVHETLPAPVKEKAAKANVHDNQSTEISQTTTPEQQQTLMEESGRMLE